MRRFLFTLLMMLFVSILSAQEGNLTIKSGNQWNVCYKDGACSCFLRWENVVINDVTYIVERDKEYCYRQDGDRVYRCSITQRLHRRSSIIFNQSFGKIIIIG